MIAWLRRLTGFAVAVLVIYPLVGLLATWVIMPRVASWPEDLVRFASGDATVVLFVDWLWQPAWAWSVVVALGECAVIAVAVPFWAAGRDGIGGALARLVLLQLGSSIIALGSMIGWGGVSLGAIARAQVVVFCFGVLLAAVTCLPGQRLRWRVQIAAALLGLAMLGTTFYGSPFIEMAPGPSSRRALVTGCLYANPIVVLTGSAYGYDFLRGRPGRMYGYCVIGPYYPFEYPSWWVASAIYLGAAAGAGALGYRRVVRAVKEEADDV